MIEHTEAARVAPYLTDASNLGGGFAEGVAIPDTEDDVAEFLRDANARARPVTVAGRGSGLVGGRIPFGGWVLSTERMNRIVTIRDAGDGDAVAVVEPGVPLGTLHDAARARGFFYPPDPTEQDVFIGSTIATNASGACSFKYGDTRRNIQALRVALANGEILALRRGQVRAGDGRLRLTTEAGTRIDVPLPRYRMPDTKHVAGYFAAPNLDAVDLFIGSEGSLGVVTQAECRLLIAPEAVFALYAFFPAEEAAWAFAIAARTHARQAAGPLQARAIEYFDRGSLALLRPTHPSIPDRAQAAISIEQESSASSMPGQINRWRDEMASAGGIEAAVWLARAPEEHRRFKAVRRALPVAINEQRRRVGQPKVGTDIAVPDARLLDMLRAYRQTLDRLGQPYCVFGHIGDNHLHANVMPRSETELAAAREAAAELVAAAIALGGTPSAEHGIGKLKRAFLGQLYSEQDLAEMRRVKAALDPQWILGRGNIFEAPVTPAVKGMR